MRHNGAALLEAREAIAGIAKDAISRDGAQRTLTVTVRHDGRIVSEMAVHFVVRSAAN